MKRETLVLIGILLVLILFVGGLFLAIKISKNNWDKDCKELGGLPGYNNECYKENSEGEFIEYKIVPLDGKKTLIKKGASS